MGISISNAPTYSNRSFSSSLRANTAIAAVISVLTLTGTSWIKCLMRSTAPASTMALLLRSELAAKFLSVEMAWHWISSLSSYESSSIKGLTKPSSMMGDSLAGWMEMFRIQATDDKISGKNEDLSNRSKGGKPLHWTISSWYFSICRQEFLRKGGLFVYFFGMTMYYLPSDARFLNANAAWHCTLRLFVSISWMRYCTSLESDWASFFRLTAVAWWMSCCGGFWLHIVSTYRLLQCCSGQLCNSIAHQHHESSISWWGWV